MTKVIRYAEVTILFNTNEMHKAIAEAMQAMWKDALGADVFLANQESKVFLATRSQGDYQIARASWIADYVVPMTFLDVFADRDNDARYYNVTYIIIWYRQLKRPTIRRCAGSTCMKLNNFVRQLRHHPDLLYGAALRCSALCQGLCFVALGVVDFQTSPARKIRKEETVCIRFRNRCGRRYDRHQKRQISPPWQTTIYGRRRFPYGPLGYDVKLGRSVGAH